MSPLPSGLSTKPECAAPAEESTVESRVRLQQAIECLALNLDDELHRYRQSRSGQSPVPPTPARLKLRQTRRPIDLISVKAAATAAATAVPIPPPANARLQELLGQAAEPTAQAYPPKTAIHQVRLSHGGTLTTYRAAPEENLESTEALLRGSPQGAAKPDDTDYEPSLLSQLATPMGVGALLLLLLGSATFGYLVTSPQAVSHLTDNPIARRMRGIPVEGDLVDGAGEGAASGTVAQPESDFKPAGPDLSAKEFAPLDLGRISTLPTNPSARPSRSAPADGLASGGDALAEPLRGRSTDPDSAPMAAARPSTSTPVGVEALRPTVAPNPAIATSPRSTAQPSAVTPARPTAVPTAPSPAVAPAQPAPPPAVPAAPPQPLAINRTPPPLATPPAPLTAPPAAPARVAPPAPITQAPAAPSPIYYVVTNYSGAQSLDAARSVVSDAYVRNFSSGTRIQMGAFSQPSSAQNLVNQLQQQGIPAQVITP